MGLNDITDYDAGTGQYARGVEYHTEQVTLPLGRVSNLGRMSVSITDDITYSRDRHGNCRLVTRLDRFTAEGVVTFYPGGLIDIRLQGPPWGRTIPIPDPRSKRGILPKMHSYACLACQDDVLDEYAVCVGCGWDARGGCSICGSTDLSNGCNGVCYEHRNHPSVT